MTFISIDRLIEYCQKIYKKQSWICYLDTNPNHPCVKMWPGSNVYILVKSVPTNRQTYYRYNYNIWHISAIMIWLLPCAKSLITQGGHVRRDIPLSPYLRSKINHTLIVTCANKHTLCFKIHQGFLLSGYSWYISYNFGLWLISLIPNTSLA